MTNLDHPLTYVDADTSLGSQNFLGIRAGENRSRRDAVAESLGGAHPFVPVLITLT